MNANKVRIKLVLINILRNDCLSDGLVLVNALRNERPKLQ